MILPAWLMGGLLADLRNRIVGGAAPPAVTAFHMANDMDLTIRPGRNMDVSGTRRDVERDRTVYGKRTVENLTFPLANAVTRGDTSTWQPKCRPPLCGMGSIEFASLPSLGSKDAVLGLQIKQ